MPKCVIYARVSTKEQQDEGYSIPAQLKAIRAFCEREGLSPVAEFVEAESAGRAGRKQFSAMCDFLASEPGRARRRRPQARPALPQLPRRDHARRGPRRQASLRPLRHPRHSPRRAPARREPLGREVLPLEPERRGQEGHGGEGRPGRLASPRSSRLPQRQGDAHSRRGPCDRSARPSRLRALRLRARLVSPTSPTSSTRSGSGRLGQQAPRLGARSRCSRTRSTAGLLRYKGELYPGSHEPLITRQLFDQVQDAFIPNRRGNSREKRSYVLRDFLYCSECGAKITAGTHKGHVYYRCTHGKGDCSQRSYIREELLMDEVASVLERIAIDPEIAAALLEEARIREAQAHELVCLGPGRAQGCRRLGQAPGGRAARLAPRWRRLARGLRLQERRPRTGAPRFGTSPG